MSKKNRIPESKLIKALAELESVAKGDALEEADPEGGLSTEGEPLSDEAPRGRGETKKSRRASASSPFGSAASSSAESSSDDDDDDDDDEDEDSPPEPPKKKKEKKVSKAAKRSSSSSAESSSEDDADKSFRDRADDDETMSKGIKVNDFLESMVDQLSLALLHVKESVAKSIAASERRVIAHVDAELAKGGVARREFDVRIAKALSAIGTAVQDDLLPLVDVVKSFSDQPVGGPRGKAVLSKGEVNQPPWSGQASLGADQRLASGSDGDYVEDLRGIGAKGISDWLFKKSANNQLDPNVMIAWEADRYDPAMLPAQLRKAIVDDLAK